MVTNKDTSLTQKEKMIKTWLIHLGWSEEDITKRAIDKLKVYRYKEIVRPMIIADREKKGLSYPVLARQYRVSKATVKWICNNYK